jgi:hypothetical protein
MLKRTIKYTNYDDEETEDIFYFNLSKPELVEMEVEHEQGLGKFLQGIIDTKDHKALIEKFKEIVLKAYGEKSPDGKRFIKSDQLREEFSQTAAYSTLFMELAIDDGAAATFIMGILPKDMTQNLDPKTLELVPQPAPTPPTPPNS